MTAGPSCCTTLPDLRRVLRCLVALLFLFALPAHLSAQEGTAATHIVQPGETLSQIAQRYGTTTEAILTLNGVDDADAIVVGQRLEIPGADAAAAEPAPPGMHRVQSGETLSAIASTYGVDQAELMAINAIDDPDAVYSGQLLALPGLASPAAETPFVEPTALPLETPLPAETPEASAFPAANPDVHTVQPGETLSGIAKRYGLALATLKALNAIGDANRIFVGQELALSAPTPTPDAPAAPTAAAVGRPDEAPIVVNQATEHVVQAGETLSSIAAHYGVTLEALKQWNDIDDENAIYTGQPLVLAAAETPPPATPTPGVTPESTPLPEAPQAPIVRSGNPAASLNATYTVLPGDSLARIALRQGVDADALRALNGFDDLGARLAAGQQLLLPATGDALLPQTPARRYTVKPGETLSAIASTFEVTTADLLAANRIADANAIYPGQELAIPPKSPPGAVQVGPARGGYYYYTVQSGDTLSAVALQFNTTMQAIRTYNGLPDDGTIYAGLELRIPHGAPPLSLRFPPAPRSGHRFIISLSRQQCWVYQGERLLYAWSCSTGYGERRTKAGNFAVQSKIANAKSNVWRLDMPYWLGIYDVGVFENGIHGLPMDWDTGKKIWSGLIGQPATFGCAMLDDLNAATLFRLAYLGMPVHIIN